MTKLPKVLLLGDSIRMSYQGRVADALKDSADVVGPAENGAYSLYTLASLERWLHELGTPDVVHWNNGIHDCGHNPDRSPAQIPIEIYGMTIDFILQRLLLTQAHVIWVTTTPVHPDFPFPGEGWAWKNEEIDRYNAVALELMKHHDIPVNDLHAIVAADPDAYLAEDKLHLSEAGIVKCADAVVAAIKPFLKHTTA